MILHFLPVVLWRDVILLVRHVAIIMTVEDRMEILDPKPN